MCSSDLRLPRIGDDISVTPTGQYLYEDRGPEPLHTSCAGVWTVTGPTAVFDGQHYILDASSHDTRTTLDPPSSRPSSRDASSRLVWLRTDNKGKVSWECDGAPQQERLLEEQSCWRGFCGSSSWSNGQVLTRVTRNSNNAVSLKGLLFCSGETPPSSVGADLPNTCEAMRGYAPRLRPRTAWQDRP